MRTLLLCVLLVCGTSPVQAAWTSDGTNAQRVDFSSNTAFDLPDGDWTLGGWIRVAGNVGSSFGVIIRTGGAGDSTNPALHFGCRQASAANPGVIQIFALNDNDTTDFNSFGTVAQVCASATPFHFLLARDSGTLRIYVNGVEEVGGGGALTNLNALTFAAGHALLATSADLLKLNGALCDWAKWNRFLTAGERTGLAQGFSARFFPASQTWHAPMIREYQELRSPITVTNQGSTISACPRLYYPF